MPHRTIYGWFDPISGKTHRVQIIRTLPYKATTGFELLAPLMADIEETLTHEIFTGVPVRDLVRIVS